MWYVGTRFTDLIGGTQQIDIFEDNQETVKLHQAMDSIKKQFEEQCMMRAEENSATNNRSARQ